MITNADFTNADFTIELALLESLVGPLRTSTMDRPNTNGGNTIWWWFSADGCSHISRGILSMREGRVYASHALPGIHSSGWACTVDNVVHGDMTFNQLIDRLSDSATRQEWGLPPLDPAIAADTKEKVDG